MTPARSCFRATEVWGTKRLLRFGMLRRLSLLFGSSVHRTSPERLDDRLEAVRAMMLSRLGRVQATATPLSWRIKQAGDIQGLWYLRSELMLALATAYGETIARHEIRDITDVFQGALPRAMRPRAAPPH
ncbi:MULTISPECIES: hypothetical protein [Polaromonas]|uniref:Uncharacterized protein n=1 Tax=Polaromonas aquatica TaxID=332657 RepID=A0ABW1TZA1_9BURK